jgi:hypothetical protein
MVQGAMVDAVRARAELLLELESTSRLANAFAAAVKVEECAERLAGLKGARNGRDPVFKLL